MIKISAYIKTIKDVNGNTIYPQTKADAIFMTGYEKPTTGGEIVPTDTIKQAIGKLDKDRAIMPVIRVVGTPEIPNGTTVTANNGSIQYSATFNNNVANITVNGFGIYTLTLSVSEYTNESVTVDAVKLYNIEMLSINATLNNNSWKAIHAVSNNGANYWSVGDRKAIDLSGTIGTQPINGTYYVFILGFNHNSSKEGNGIHFGGFKTALSGGIDICLVDNNYATSSTNGSKWFNMNHSANTNSGGWQGCDLRYDILGSVNSKGEKDANTSTATNPVANTLMSTFPADLRSVMQPMIKYSNNTGGGSDTANYVTSTTDYLPLLSEFEIFGVRTYANTAEKNYQTQYAYYTNGNSKIKYKHNSTTASAFWWERSVDSGSATNFCGVGSNGNASNNLACASYGLAPAFKV